MTTSTAPLTETPDETEGLHYLTHSRSRHTDEPVAEIVPDSPPSAFARA
jgi:hypothetical protein